MWLGHHFQDQKVKGQGHQAALLSTALTRKATAANSVGTYSAWGKYCYVASAGRRASSHSTAVFVNMPFNKEFEDH